MISKQTRPELIAELSRARARVAELESLLAEKGAEQNQPAPPSGNAAGDGTGAAHDSSGGGEEDRFRIFVEHFYDGILMFDERGNIDIWNRAQAEITGIPPEAAIGRPHWEVQYDLLTPETLAIAGREELLAIMRNAFAAGSRQMLDAPREVDIVATDGERKSVLVSAFAIDTARGYRIGSIFRDITERRRAEQALRTSEEKYRGLLESLDSAITTFDDEGTVLYLNHVAASQLGGRPEELIGKRMHELFPEPHASRQLATIRKTMAEARSTTVETLTTVADGPRWFRTTLQPIRDETGRVVQVLVNSTDIHDLKTTQQQLVDLNRTLEERVQQRTAELQDLYDNAPAGYHSVDGEGRIVMMNQTELAWLGYDRAEIVGMPVIDIMAPASVAIFHEYFPLLKERGWVRDMEMEMLCKDGRVLPILLNGTAVYDDEGRFVMSRSTVFDNTERKQVDEALRRANLEMERALRMKDEFLANMSHELRTPLNGILTLSEVLLEQINGPLNERQVRALRNVYASGEHLLALINDLLDLSKIEAGKQQLFWETVDANEVCQASLTLVRQLAQMKQIQLTYTSIDPPAKIQVDPRRLKQMLVNLLSNGIKFTPEGGQVQLSVAIHAAAGRVEFAVKDSGIGIPAEDLPRLFQPFVQLDAGLSRRYEGTGLGLALVKRLAGQHGGDVTVASTGVPGEGSCFTIVLPYAPPASEALVTDGVATDTLHRADGRASRHASHVLMAEDDELTILAVSDYLKGVGYRCSVARTGREALDRALELRPDLILMDIHLPGADGLEVIRRLRNDRYMAGIPIIAVTALAQPGDRERCLQAGADHYLSKPIRLAELRAHIESLLSI